MIAPLCLAVRKLLTFRDFTHCADQGATVRVWAAAAVENPLSGDLGSDMAALEAIGAALGAQLGRLALETLAASPSDVLAYGKAAIVGVAGALSHGEAILHPALGKPLRAVLGRGQAIIPSTLKFGGPGTRIDVPLHGVDDAWDFAALGAIEAGSAEAPLPDEILVTVALSAKGAVA